MKNILITGATGHMGGVVIETLLKSMNAENITVLTRSSDKQTEFSDAGFYSFLGSYADLASLEKAMTNVDSVLLISSGDQGDRMQEHKNVIDTAKKMGVKNIAYTSRSLMDRATLKNPLMDEHFATEELIKASNLNYIIFRNALYMDAAQQFVGGDRVFETGIAMPAGDGKVAYALRREQAEAMGNVLATEDFENQTYAFTGNSAYSFYDVANVLTELSGKKVNYKALELSEFENMMNQRGLPASMVAKIANFNLDIKNGQEATVTNELELKLGRKPADLKIGLKELFNL